MARAGEGGKPSPGPEPYEPFGIIRTGAPGLDCAS